MEKILQIMRMVTVLVTVTVSMTNAQAGTLGFYLNGVAYPDDSTVLRTDIGEGDDALQCTTDRLACCALVPNRAGQFFFPNGDRVPVEGSVGSSGYYRDRDDRLNRQSENGVATGRFHCDIPSGTITDSMLFINIVDISVSVTPSGDSDNTAGQMYILNCIVSVSGSAVQPTIFWLGGGAETDFATDTARTVSMTSGSDGSYSSTLTFNPLAVSHAGTYICRATLGGAEVNGSTEVIIKAASASEAPTTQVPSLTTTTSSTAVISERSSTIEAFTTIAPSSPTEASTAAVPSPTPEAPTTMMPTINIVAMIAPTGTPTAGETFSLDCSVSGVDDPATYQWFDSNGTQLANTSELQFSPLRASEGGDYTCHATVRGVVLEETTTVNVHLPAPTAVTVTPPAGMIIAGSRSSSLICTIELNPAVDIPVTVTTEWSGPEGTMFLLDKVIPAVMVNLTVYTSTATISVARNGSYTCQAAVSPNGTTSESINITVAPLPPPTILTVSSPTATSITLTWEQLEGADAVDSYMLYYEYTVRQCSGNEGLFQPVTTRISDGSLREYTVENSSDTPVEEDSEYSTITLRAINIVDTSEPSNSVTATTGTATPGPPPSLAASSVSVSSITIQWDPVPCQDRNHLFNNYAVNSFPSSNPSVMSGVGLVPVTNRVFTASNLSPRTSYTFQIQALNLFPIVRGLFANLTVNTSAPTNLGFLLDGQLYGNNSVVTVTDIGSSFFMSALFCLTPSLECCSDSETPNAASVTREWYLPDGTPVPSTGTVFSREQVSSAVALYRSGGTSPSGVYCCEIPDASATRQNIYIGIYPQGDGSLSITSVLFDRNSTTLTCTSTGGPPTTITWRKDGILVDLSLYEQSQRLVDAVEATYQSILFNDNVTNFVGAFTCEISNARVTVPVRDTLELNVRDEFSVGESATASCKSDAPASMIEWLRDGVVVESAAFTGIQELDLVFSPVNDSIHTQVYVCRVTREGRRGMIVTAAQNFTVNVDVSPNAVTATVSSSGTATAGMVYNLTCNVSKTVGGLIDSPTAIWTTGGEVVTNGNGITVSGTTGEMTVTSTLTFNPLRTSHEGNFMCSGTLTSPALDSALMSSAPEQLNVQISTPDVDITVPSGPLFAGRIAPLTLTCTISINSATDTDIEISDTDITWLRGSTRLSNDDSRVTISSVTGSRPSFTSTLTLDPLSTADNTTFTCRARARPPNVQSFVIASEVGQGITPVVVNFPSPPTVSIDPFNRLEMAGQSLTLNCSASIQEGIRGTPVLTWTREDASLSSDVTSAPPLLSFPSLRTSHAGRYTCTARLNIPEAGVDIPGTNTTSIVVQIPPPTLTITGYPRDSGFFRGLVFNFTCMIAIDPSVDTGVTVEAGWKRNGSQFESSVDGRITVINTSLDSVPYRTNISFNATDFKDDGTYNCTARIIPLMPEFIVEATGFITRTITVLNFPPQLVTITDEGVSTAGYTGYTLVCTANRVADLNPLSTLTVQWLDSEGNMITNRDDFSISGTQGPSSDVSITSRLTFNNILLTSQAGLYTCRTLLTIPGTVVDHQVEDNFTVSIKLPALEVIAISESRGGLIYEGTMFSLTCLITPNMTGVNTDITIQRTFSGPGTSAADRVTTENDAFQTTLMFRPVAMTDDGRYVCSASAISTPQYPSVEASNETENRTIMAISPLPAPEVTITAPPTPTGGQSYTLDCSARTEDYVISVPTVEWVSIDNSDRNITQPPQINGTASANHSLTFNQIRTSHGGRYTCRASIDIPMASITDRANTAMEDVRVQIPASVVIVSEGSFPAYNGTVYNLTGMLQLDTSIVDTDITVIWEWSLNGQVLLNQNTSAAPHMITIPFIPLATSDSGLYSMSLNQRPTNPQYVVLNSDSSTTYSLTVLSLPLPVPSIAITARSDDRCSQAMTFEFTCSATTVDNLYRPPRIEWRYDGSAVPDSSNPRMNSTTSTGQLIFSSIMSENSRDYTCRAIITIPESGIGEHYGETSTTVNTAIPARVQNLECRGNRDDVSLSISWGEPMAQGTTVIGYSIECRRVNQSPSRELVTVPLTPAYDVGVDETQAQVTQGLAAEVPYSVTVKAINLAGCGEERQIYCFTREGVPPPPENVVVVRFDSTSIGVSWNKFTLVELKGLANYTVTYSIIIGSRKRQSQLGGTLTVPWTENRVIIPGLQPGAEYDITVRTSTAAGMSAAVGPGNRVSTTTPPPQTAVAPSDSASSGSDNTVAIIGGVVAAIVITIVIAITVLIAIALLVKGRRAEFSPNQKPLPYEAPGSVMLSDLSPTTNKERDVYETIEADHEYEILDKYNQPQYDDVKVPGPPKPEPKAEQPRKASQSAPASDYEFTQCPAYIPVSNTSIHGNTIKQMDTPSAQPNAAQDDA